MEACGPENFALGIYRRTSEPNSTDIVLTVASFANTNCCSLTKTDLLLASKILITSILEFSRASISELIAPIPSPIYSRTTVDLLCCPASIFICEY